MDETIRIAVLDVIRMESMRKIRRIMVFVSLALFVFFSAVGRVEAEKIPSPAKGDLPEGIEQVVFIELGSVKCIPCRKMQPVMEAVEKEYAGKVKIVFHDVWTKEGKEQGKKYGVRLIPTQVFMDKQGNELFRHEGFLSREAIDRVLAEAGVSK